MGVVDFIMKAMVLLMCLACIFIIVAFAVMATDALINLVF